MNQTEIIRWAQRDMNLAQTTITRLVALATDECELLDLVWESLRAPAPADTSALVLPDDFCTEAL